MGVLETIRDFVRHHEVSDVAKELNKALKDEKYIEKIDKEIISLCDDGLRHCAKRKEILHKLEQVKNVVRNMQISEEGLDKNKEEIGEAEKNILDFTSINEEEYDLKKQEQEVEQAEEAVEPEAEEVVE